MCFVFLYDRCGRVDGEIACLEDRNDQKIYFLRNQPITEDGPTDNRSYCYETIAGG